MSASEITRSNDYVRLMIIIDKKRLVIEVVSRKGTGIILDVIITRSRA